MSSELDRQGLVEIFVIEASEAVDALTKAFHPSDGAKPNPDQLQEQYVWAHKIRGAAALYGYEGLATMGALLESTLEEGPTIEVSSWPKALEILREIVISFASQLKVIAQGGAEDLSVSDRWKGEVAGLFPSRAADAAVEPKLPAPEYLVPLALPAQAAIPIAPMDQIAMAVMGRSEEYACLDVESSSASSTVADEYLLPLLDAEVLSYFAPEAQEYLESLEAQLLCLEKDQDNPEVINQLFRTAHTLKGSAYTVGFQSIGDLTHYVEDFMGAVREGRVKILPGHTDVLLRSVDVMRLLMRRDPASLGMLRQRYATAMSGLTRLEQLAADQALASGSTLRPVEESVKPTLRDQQEPEFARVAEDNPADGKAVEDRDAIRVSRDRLERLMNLVGELVIGRGRLEQRLYLLEQLSQQVLTYKSRLLESVRSFADEHTFTLPTFSSGPGTASAHGINGLRDFGSLEFDKYDDFNILARRISEVTADISESMIQLRGSIHNSHDDMSQLAQLTLGMRDEITRARMVPIGTPFTRFRRATREMARATGKEVTLVTSGEHTEVDTSVVERLVDPLIHLVRNAVYHGIEPVAVRLSKDKPAAGTIYLHAAHRGNTVLIEVEDDGAGLDIEKIRTKAVERGLIRPEVARSLPEAEVIKFIFVPGFSTADAIGDQAGRGVGMDVVKRVIESMNGHIDVESVLGVGTKFTLTLPLTLLIATALMVRAGSERYAIPLPAVREVTMLTRNSHQLVGERSILHIGEEAIEVQSLEQLLHRSSVPVETGKPVVIVRTAAGMIGLSVDELLGRQEIVIKPLGSFKSLDRSSFGGATIDPEGRVVLVLDPARLFARGAQAAVEQELSPGARALADSLTACVEAVEPKTSERWLLLIDDSLSVRKFVGRMLESAGYKVHTAVDGEEGLRMASAQPYRLILTDLEMPKVNGYEVIQGLRSRAQTQQTPIVVMTTRAGDKHRQMALNIGASSYIAKPVEERALIQEVERLIGKEAAARNGGYGD